MRHAKLLFIPLRRVYALPGVKPWRPLLAHQTDDMVFADPQPIKNGSATERGEIARWFY